MAATDCVFVVHGRNTAARDALFTFLRSIGLRPLEWTQAIEAAGHPSPMITQVLDAALGAAQAIVVLFTGDDEVRLRRQFASEADWANEFDLLPQARPNVLFEAGLALGRAPDRTVFVELGSVKPFSDNAGRHTVRFDGSTQRRQELAAKLRLAGCVVDLSGTDWHRSGDFTLAIEVASAQIESIKPPRLSPWLARALLSVQDDFSGDVLATTLEVSDADLVNASKFTCRVVQRKQSYWTFGWKVNVGNVSKERSAYRLEFRYLDAEGHALYDSKDFPDVVVGPGETKQLSGVASVDSEVSPAVNRVLLILSPRAV